MMSVYSIKDLEHLSGIKAHTIRMWEQRYNLFSPQRTATNIRYYDDEDVKLILNIAALKDHGMKISRIVAMPMEEMQREVRRLTMEQTSEENQIKALTLAMLDMDETAFCSILESGIQRLGFENTMMRIIYPFMKKIGVLWLTDAINPAHEHFISHLVRQKLIAATDALPATQHGDLYLLFLPEGELHELGLLFANYMLRSRGLKTIFFGQTVPLDALEDVYHKLKPTFLMTALTSVPEVSETQAFINKLSKKFEEATLCITGSRVVGQDLSIPKNMVVLNQFEDLLQHIPEQITSV